MFYPNYKKRGNHEENRYKICLYCCKKSKKMIVIQGKVQLRLKKLFPGFDASDLNVPAVLCPACDTRLRRSLKEGQMCVIPEMEKFVSIKFSTRGFTKTSYCQCHICTLVSGSVVNFSAKAKPVVVRKIETRKQNAYGPITRVKEQAFPNKRCVKCLGLLSRGIRHVCNMTNLMVNVQTLPLNSRQKGQLAARLLKDRMGDVTQNSNAPGHRGLVLSQQCGKPLTVNVGPKENNMSPSISVDSMRQMQTALDLSTRKTLSIASFIIAGTNTRRIIESNFKQKMLAQSHVFDEYFEARNLPLIATKSQTPVKSPQTVIICKNLGGFIQKVLGERQASDVHMKFGIDGGGGFLKFCLSIQPLTARAGEEPQPSTSRAEYTDKFRESGVKRLFIICLAPNTQECYENVSLMWSDLNINPWLGTIATDLKLANIISGLMSNSSAHPCTWCDAEQKSLIYCGNYRTVGNCKENSEMWHSDGALKTRAKFFKNCIYPPLFDSGLNQRILDIIPPPELHLLLGAVNTLFQHMMRENKDVSLQWAHDCHVDRQCTYGSPMFEGNACKTLLDKVDILEAKKCLSCVKYVEAFRTLKKVVESCFSVNLDPDFKAHIRKFHLSYEALGVPVTPKIHCILHHVVEFCSKNKRGLGFYSEQSVESAHSDFTKTWTRYKVLKSHPDYPLKLLHAVCEYNTLHL